MPHLQVLNKSFVQIAASSSHALFMQDSLPVRLLVPRLASQREFWEHWGFFPWREGPFEGVARSQHFVKDGILGKMAEYRAWEAIVWETGTEEQREKLWLSRVPMPDVVTQRFLFLVDEPWPQRRIRSFFLGLRGYVEFFACKPGEEAHAKARDLSGLVAMALQL